MNNTPHRPKLSNQAEAVLHYISIMDIEMINDLLDDDKTYQDFPKHLFVQKLDNALYRFQKAGDTHLNTYTGTCKSEECSLGCKGKRFIGNNSGMYLDLIIKQENGQIIDIYECHSFSTISPKTSIHQKVLIDRSGLPDSLLH